MQKQQVTTRRAATTAIAIRAQGGTETDSVQLNAFTKMKISSRQLIIS